ncbi:hypothetical protein [Hymenobacter rubripertinctus]|uniref:hypothetical protein n=1 Tax=Hymenobacter rubripertinctus TaxID=2029981 RepID=UPI0011C40813|nr:hypothetical protein [Hymenobacter rubripertinctus]
MFTPSIPHKPAGFLTQKPTPLRFSARPEIARQKHILTFGGHLGDGFQVPEEAQIVVAFHQLRRIFEDTDGSPGNPVPGPSSRQLFRLVLPLSNFIPKPVKRIAPR